MKPWKGGIELLRYLKVKQNTVSVSIKRDYIEISDSFIKSIDVDWYVMYEKLKAYYNEYGDINVPIYYKTSDGSLLGHWLSNIRSSYKKPTLANIRLTTKKIELLEQLGMDWSPMDTQWESRRIL